MDMKLKVGLSMSILGLLVVAWLTQLAIGNPAGPSSNEEDFRCETYFSNTNTKNLDIGDDDLRQCRINPHRFITQYQGRNQDTINIVVEPIDEPIRFRHQPTLSFGDYFPNEEKASQQDITSRTLMLSLTPGLTPALRLHLTLFKPMMELSMPI